MTRVARGRGRGAVDRLPSGTYRVRVYAGQDPLTGKRHYLTEMTNTAKEAEKARTRLLGEVDERRNPRSRATVDQLLDRYLEVVELERTTRQGYVGKIEKHIRPEIGHIQAGRVDAELLESLYALLRKCREHCKGRKFVQHRTDKPHDCDDRCKPHVCKPLAAASILVVHAILSGAFEFAVRWRWVSINPVPMARKPAVPTPNPRPPTAAQAAALLNAAWSDDPDWGMYVWLAMVTGARRGELCGIRLSRVDLDASVLTVEKSQGQIGGERWEKDTKTHQSRRLALDTETVELLRAHIERARSRATMLGLTLAPDAFLFSLDLARQIPLRPDTVTQRYGRLTSRLGIKTNVKALRHYSATELIAAGVDPRTVAGRLGHSGGGSTTLRVYSAWVSEADQRAAAALARRVPRPPADSLG